MLERKAFMMLGPPREAGTLLYLKRPGHAHRPGMPGTSTPSLGKASSTVPKESYSEMMY